MRSKTGSVRRLHLPPAQPVGHGRARPAPRGSAPASWSSGWWSGPRRSSWRSGTSAPRRSGGEPGAAMFLAVWLAAAGFGLWSGVRRLVRLMLRARSRRRCGPRWAEASTRRWDDGIDPRATRRSRHPPESLHNAHRLPGRPRGGRRRARGRRRLVLMRAAHPFRGPLFMVLSTCSYVDQRHADEARDRGPAALRGAGAARGLRRAPGGCRCCCSPATGRQLPLMFEPRVVVRNLCETAGILCYVVALANMPIADVSALAQITPLLVILGAALLLGEPVGGLRMALIGCGFVGALMVAQPTGGGISVYALLALGNAVFAAARDLVGRRVPAGGAGAGGGAVGVGDRAPRRRGGASGLRGMGGAGRAQPAAARRGGALPVLRPLLHLHGLPGRADADRWRRSSIPSPSGR